MLRPSRGTTDQIDSSCFALLRPEFFYHIRKVEFPRDHHCSRVGGAENHHLPAAAPPA
jgi:hypothetical protein